VYKRYLELKKGSAAVAEVWGKELNKSVAPPRNEQVQKPKNPSTMSSMGKKLLERSSFGTVTVRLHAPSALLVICHPYVSLPFCIAEWNFSRDLICGIWKT